MYTHPQNQTVEIKRTHFTGYSIKHTKSKKYEKLIVVDDFNASITDITGVYRNTATAEVMLFLMMIAAVMLPTPKHFL